MWIREYSGSSSATPARVFAVLADTGSWPAWNAGVVSIDMDGPFAAGTSAVMTMPDGTALPFRLTWVDPEHGFEDETPVPDAGVVVRVRHELTPTEEGTSIVYRCEVEGPDYVAAEVGAAVSADFPEVIAALAERAERGSSRSAR